MANLHSFTGNEVIATDVPKYLNQNFSALNEEATALSNTVVKTVNNTSPVNGNVNIVGFDSYWSANEQVSVGDIRIPKGRENSGLFFECVKAGTTGSSQPEVDTTVLADFSDVGRIGQVRWIYNIAEKDDDEIFATGVAYSRATYSALWQYVQSKPALLITEAEWQKKYTATGGKFVPYYSSGDGSTTFRTPLLCAYATGVADNSKIGTFKEAGLPNITGTIRGTEGSSLTQTGAFYYTGVGYNGAGGGSEDKEIGFDASRCSDIYGKSDTVTPDTMYGVWVIKAFGLIVNADNTDVKGVLTGIENVTNRVSTIEGYDYVIETYRSGTSWYRKYKSGWVEQGGYVSVSSYNQNGTVTFSKAFANTDYTVLTASGRSEGNGQGEMHLCQKTNLNFIYHMTSGSSYFANYAQWYACGQGA